jgi:two-component system response regulator HydG
MPEAKATMLVVDDSMNTLEVLRRNLESQGYRVHTSPGAAEAIELLETTPVDLVITDLKMPKLGGIDLVRHVRDNLTDTAVMMITGHATIESAVKAVKTGAEEYLPKPFTDEELITVVDRVLAKQRERRAASAAGRVRSGDSHGIIGESPAIREVLRAIEKTAASSATVLISGESGVGKELVARAIHYGGARTSGPFVPVNCGAIPEQLVESELFGHVKGAFTGATAARNGFFRTADSGTIFLDEVSELSPATQVKLLRVLQEGEVAMVGTSQPYRVDVRVLAATNRDLRALMKKGAFREDLFFRLNVINIEIPPLRHRGDDVLLLTNHLISKFAEAAGRPIARFTGAALDALKSYSWPGNVRELENVLNHLVVMAESETIDVSDFPATMRFSIKVGASCTQTLANVETEYIRNVLESVDGNKSKAAKILGIDRKTLREKLKLMDGA